MIALVVFSELFDDSRLSKRLYKHGELTRPNKLDSDNDSEKNLIMYPIAWMLSGFKKPNRFFNVREFNWSYKSWMVRKPEFLSLLELSAVDRINSLKFCFFYLTLFYPLIKKDIYKIKTYYLIWQWLKKRNKFLRLSYKIWRAILQLRIKSGMKAVYTDTYGPDHPVTLAFKGEEL
jgi:hypothetical protein